MNRNILLMFIVIPVITMLLGGLSWYFSSGKDIERVKKETELSERINQLESLLDKSNQFHIDVQKEHQINISELNKQLEVSQVRLERKNNELSGVRIVSWHTFSTGEYDRGVRVYPRHYCGHNIQQEAQRLCGTYEANIYRISSRSGDKCGYADYVVACLSK